EFADRLQDLLQRLRRVNDGQYPPHQVEVQRSHVGPGGERPADQDFFGGAVHLQDAQFGPQVSVLALAVRMVVAGGVARGVVAVCGRHDSSCTAIYDGSTHLVVTTRSSAPGRLWIRPARLRRLQEDAA